VAQPRVEPTGTVPIDDGRPRGSPDTPPRPHVFLLLQCDRPREPTARFGLHRLDEVILGRADTRELERTTQSGVRRLRIGLPDPTVSTVHARLSQVFGRWFIEDAGSRNGTLLDGRPCQREALRDGALVEIGRTILRYRDAIPTAADDPLDHDARASTPPAGLDTLLPTFGRELAKLARVAASELPITILGGTGVGKEVLARSVHRISGRRGELVAVNCGALPQGLVESELFGHRKGTFTGADADRIGLVQAAHGGTLFLDEIGDLALPSQAALLRVLQEREVRPIGATRSVPVDLRVIAATHRDLQQQVALGTFRADLYARLIGFTLQVPRLHDRIEDLGLVIARLLERLAPGGEGPTFSIETARALATYAWPLNIRELEQALSAALVLSGAQTIELSHLPDAIARAHPIDPTPTPASTPDDSDARIRADLIAALQEHHGNISAVARALGKARTQVQRWLKRFDLDAESFRH